jgi:ribosomal protein S18 acetylase RimI-like enzyme
MEIRLAELADVTQLRAMFEHFFAYNAGQQPHYYRRAVEEGSYPKYVIESSDADLFIVLDGSAIIGLMHIEEKTTPPYSSFVPHKYADVAALFVDPTYRGQGVGDRLIRAGKKWAKARQLDYLELFVLAENDGALRFYEKMGFQTMSHNMRMTL